MTVGGELNMSKRSLPLAALLAVLALAFLPRAGQAADAAGAYKIGSRVAEFKFKSDEGKTVKLSDYRGKTVVLVFFGTW